MIDQTMIDIVSAHLEVGDLSNELAQELLDNYIKLVEQNAELHKELAKFRTQSFTVQSNIKCSDIPDNLAM